MEGGQSGTYLRQTRVLSGPRVSVAKTYRDEEGHCDLAKIFISMSLSDAHPWARQHSRLS